MRITLLLGSLTALISACGDDGGTPPRVISGGGIGDGPIDGVANVYVIDDTSREPISGATVRVGDVDGVTDADGLFVARGVTGPQNVVVTAPLHRADLWIGANGTNMTFDMEVATEPATPAATLTGSIDLSSVTVPPGHFKVASVTYSQTDDLGDPANQIATLNDANVCNAGLSGTSPCNFTVKVRTGQLALIAAVFDLDTKGTMIGTDDTLTLVRWASRSGIMVTGGVDLSGQNLTLIDAGMTANVTVDFGSPPSGLTTNAGLIGIDTVSDGVIQLGLFRTPTDPTLLTPKLTAFGATGYRLTGIAKAGTSPTAAESVVLRRDLTGPTLSAGTWLAPPTGATVTRTGASWTNAADATVHSVEYAQGTAKLLNVSMFDGSSEFTIPDLVVLPTGPITAKVNALGAPGLDVTDFSLDEQRDSIQMVSSQPVQIN